MISLLVLLFLVPLTATPVAAAPEPGSPVTVNSTGNADDSSPGNGVCDTGGTNASGQTECTLRAAISETNRSSRNHIHFNIPNSDPGRSGSRWTIDVPNTLPSVQGDTEIEGNTQPGWNGSPVVIVENVGNVGTGIDFLNGNEASLEHIAVTSFGSVNVAVRSSQKVVIANNYIGVDPSNSSDGSAGSGSVGLLTDNGSRDIIISNNTIGHNSASGVWVRGGSFRTTIDGNFIGVLSTGSNVGNGGSGIRVFGGADDTVIGGTRGNVIGNNDDHGIQSAGVRGTQIYNNTIGLTPNRQQSAGNGEAGIVIGDGSRSTVIGAVGRTNYISGNTRSGIEIAASDTIDISGNVIGTNNGLTSNFGNGAHGIYDARSYGLVSITENVIAFNDGDGVATETPGAVEILRNDIYRNDGLGIDLDLDGVTVNDNGDRDSGANQLLNYPVITGHSGSGGSYRFDFDLDTSSGSYIVSFFDNPSGLDPTGFGEGQVYLGQQSVSHGSGTSSYTSSVFSGASSGRITATLTKVSDGRTSEFGPGYGITSTPATTTTTAAPTTTTRPPTTTTRRPTTTTTRPQTTTTRRPTTTTTRRPSTTTRRPTTTTRPNTTTTVFDPRNIPAPTTRPTTTRPTTTRPPTTRSSTTTTTVLGAAPQSTLPTPPTVESSPVDPAPAVTVPEDSTQIDEPNASDVTPLVAVDDLFAVATESELVDVLANDEGSDGLRVVSVTESDFGSVRLDESGLVEIRFPKSFAGSLSFTYVVTDESGEVGTATVVVDSTNVLAPVADIGVELDEPVVSLSGLITRVETVFGDLIDIRLSSTQLTTLSFVPVLLGIIAWLLRDRERLVSVTNVPVGSTLAGHRLRDGSPFELRHDELVWARKRTRHHGGTSQTLVQVAPGQQVWVPTDMITDTGY